MTFISFQKVSQVKKSHEEFVASLKEQHSDEIVELESKHSSAFDGKIIQEVLKLVKLCFCLL